MTVETMTADDAVNEFLIDRYVDAPRSLVYRMWSEPEHMARWCCPKDFTQPDGSMDFRVGGTFFTHMRSADGVDYKVTGVYREIVPERRIVFTHAWIDESGETGLETLVTLTFEDNGNGTRLKLHQAAFATPESAASHREGWSECIDSLDDYLTELPE